MTREIPNPGSDLAVSQGCKCPVSDNARGLGCGRLDENGAPLFWLSEDCSLHNPKIQAGPIARETGILLAFALVLLLAGCA